MKKLLILICFGLFLACSENDVDINNNNYTFDGKGGIKCNVNGIKLEPTLKISPGPSTKNLDFDYYDGENYMNLNFYNDDQDPNFTIKSIKIMIFGISPDQNLEGNTYELKDEESNENYGNYIYGSFDNYYKTNSNYSGELKIIYHDIDNRILGGNFWFDAVNQNGEVVEIREGEFDMKY